MKLGDDGITSGKAAINHHGYSALDYRRYYFGFKKVDEYAKDRTEDWQGAEVKNFVVENERDLTKPFVEKFDIALEESSGGAGTIYFQPFLLDRIEKNLFRSNERLYPVGFGAPSE